MYICDRCGETQEELRTVKNWSEWGNQQVCEEVTEWSCSCGGDFVEAEECPICGEWITHGEYVCDDCASKEATVETAIEYGEENKTEIALNAFLVYMFPPSVIERILTEVMRNSADKNEQARKFCFDDKIEYADFLSAQNEAEVRERKKGLKEKTNV